MTGHLVSSPSTPWEERQDFIVPLSPPSGPYAHMGIRGELTAMSARAGAAVTTAIRRWNLPQRDHARMSLAAFRRPFAQEHKDHLASVRRL